MVMLFMTSSSVRSQDDPESLLRTRELGRQGLADRRHVSQPLAAISRSGDTRPAMDVPRTRFARSGSVRPPDLLSVTSRIAQVEQLWTEGVPGEWELYPAT